MQNVENKCLFIVTEWMRKEWKRVLESEGKRQNRINRWKIFVKHDIEQFVTNSAEENYMFNWLTAHSPHIIESNDIISGFLIGKLISLKMQSD